MQVRKKVPSPASTLLVTFVLGAAIGLSLGYAFFGENGRAARPVTPTNETKPVNTATAPVAPAPATPPGEETQSKATPVTPPSTETKPAVPSTPPPTEPAPAETANAPLTPAVPEVPMTFSPGAHLFITLGDAGLDDATCALIKEVQPSGVVLRGDVLSDVPKTLELVARLHQAMGQPVAMDAWPLVAAEQEGGDLNPFGLAAAPSASELGAALSLKDTHATAKSYAEAALARGIGVLMAPVMNIEEEDFPADPMWTKRLFGSTQGLVSQFGLEFIKGITETNVIAVARTYPGIGRLNKKNPHALRTMKYFADEEEDNTRIAEVVFPFQEAAFNKTAGILVGHVAVPGIDVDQPKRSAAFSPPLIKLILRDQWKYEGVIIADDVTSGPISKIVPPEKGVVKALAAGCDAVLFLDPDPGRIRAAVKEIQEAVDTKKLDKDALIKSRERLNVWRKQLANTNVKFPETTATSPVVTMPAATPEVKTVTPPAPAPAPETKPAETPAPTPAPEVKAVTPPAPAPAPETKPVETPAPTPAPEVKVATPAAPAPAPETKPAETPAPTPAPEVKAATPAAPAPAPEAKPTETPAPAPAPEVKAATPAAPAPAPETKPAETPTPAPAPEVKAATPAAPAPAPETKPAETPTPTPVPNTVPIASGERPPNTRRVTYTVKDNDTLATIAAKYKVAENDILAWSKRTQEEIKPGKKLTIYVKKVAEDSKAGAETAKETKDAEPPKVKKMSPDPASLPENTELYTIAEGDKLAKIAISRNTTLQKLLELNTLESADKIVIGQKLIVPKAP